LTESISGIRAALAAALDGVGGLKAYAEWPLSMQVPCVVVQTGRILYGETMGGGYTPRFDLFLLANPQQSAPQQQDSLDAALMPTGSSSLAGAIDSDPTLGGLDLTARVVGARDYGKVINIRGSNSEYASVTIEVEVLA